MTKYKKQLVLIGYTNLPTIKNLYTVTGKCIKHFDNYELRNVKDAIKAYPVTNTGKYVKIVCKNKPEYAYYDRIYQGLIKNYQELVHYINVLKKRHNLPESKVYVESIKFVG